MVSTQNLLLTLQPFAEPLHEAAPFYDIAWTLNDTDNTPVTYLFRKSGVLIISKNGIVASGNWELLPEVDALLVSVASQQRLYSPCFVLDQSVLVLRMFNAADYFILANPDKIPDLNIIDYLHFYVRSNGKLALQKRSEPAHSDQFEHQTLVEITLKNQKKIILEIDRLRSFYGAYTTASVRFKENGKPLPDGRYTFDDDTKWILVKNGVVIKSGESPNKVYPLVFWSALIAVLLTLLILQIL